MQRTVAIILACSLTLISVGRATSADYVVDPLSPAATDTNDGSGQSPFKTLAKAVDAAQAGDVVILRVGSYTEPLLPKRSGTKAKPIVFQAEKRHGAVLTATGPLLRSDPGVSYITVRGIVFRDQRRDIWQSTAQVRSDWRVEDCVFEGGGLDARLDDNATRRAENVTFLRVICQETWGNGMTAQGVNGLLVKDCLLRRCNRSGERVADCTSASKLFNTNDCRVENLVSYDNIGAGWWFDYQNTHFVITGCTLFANHGRNAENQGGGIWLEKNTNGRVTNNLVYSNYGSGLSIWSMEDLVVEDNIFVDNITTWWRAQGLDSKGGEKLWNIRFANNLIKDWRRDAHSINYTEVRNIKNVVVDGNTYDPPQGKPIWFWWGKRGQEVRLGSLDEARQVLGFEAHGKVAKIPFDRPLIPTVAGLNTQVAKDGEAFSIDVALAKAKSGDTVEIPVHGRLDISAIKGGWSTEVYDLARKRHVTVFMKSEKTKQALETAVSRFASLTPRLIAFKLAKLDEYDIRGEVLSIGEKATVAPAPRSVATDARSLHRNAFSVTSGLTLRVGDRTTVLTSSSGDNARPVAQTVQGGVSTPVGKQTVQGVASSSQNESRTQAPAVASSSQNESRKRAIYYYGVWLNGSGSEQADAKEWLKSRRDKGPGGPG